MSTGTTFLPEPAPIIAGDQEMLTAWESVRHWYGSIDDCGNNNDERKKALRRLAPYIQLACKNLSLRLKALIKEQEDGPEKASIIQTLALVHARAKWVLLFHDPKTSANRLLACRNSCCCRVLSLGPNNVTRDLCAIG